MTGMPERIELQPQIPEPIKPPEPEVPPEVEKVPGITPPPAQQQVVTTAQTQQSVQPQDQAQPQATVQVTKSDEELVKMSKGKVEESSTWLGVFLIRMIKKALDFGWQIVRGGN